MHHASVTTSICWRTRAGRRHCEGFLPLGVGGCRERQHRSDCRKHSLHGLASLSRCPRGNRFRAFRLAIRAGVDVGISL